MKKLWIIILLTLSLFMTAEEKIAKTENDLENSEEVQADSLGKTNLELQRDVEKYLQEKKQTPFFPFLLKKENFHLKSLSLLSAHFVKNGFSIFPFQIETTHFLQNFFPFYDIRNRGNLIFFRKDHYRLPVSVTQANLGLGDVNMNHAFVEFEKGNVLGLEGLHLEFGYLGQQGNWLGVNEKSANSDHHIFYDWKEFCFHYFGAQIDQKTAINNLMNTNHFPDEEIPEKFFDHNLLLENPYLDLGFRYEETEIDTIKQITRSFLMKKEFIWNNLDLQLGFEHFHYPKQKNDFQIYRINQTFKRSIFGIESDVLYKDNSYNNYYFRSDIEIGKDFTFFSKYQKFKNEWSDQNFLGYGISFQDSLRNIELQLGNCIDEFQKYFGKITNNSFFLFDHFYLRLQNILIYDDDEITYTARENVTSSPSWQLQNKFEIIFPLNYDNQIILGFDQFYISVFDYRLDKQLFRSSSSYLDGYLAIQITKRFRIQLDAQNLTAEEYLFNYPVSYQFPETHFNFFIEWQFVN